MGWFSSAALREATILKRLLKLPSYVVNGSGEATGLVDANGNPLTSSPLSLLSHRPYPWDLNLDDRIRINAACLSGYGAATLPIEFRADTTNEIFVPDGNQILYAKYGSYTAPAGFLVQGGSPAEAVFFGANSWHKIPKEFMYVGMGLRVKFKGFKNDADTGSTSFRIRLGQTSSGASGDIIVQLQTTAAAAHEMSCDIVIRITALGALTVAEFNTPGLEKLVTSATKTTNVATDRKTGFSTTADNYVTFSSTATNGGSGAAILYYEISLVP